MRGKLWAIQDQPCVDRITPACAGKTLSGSSCLSSRQDHPRVCGENYLGGYRAGAQGGSPPRVRGKPTPRSLRLSSARITPACAGKTYNSNQIRMISKDHPRVCGENQAIAKVKQMFSGSPPRVRGKLFDAHLERIELRITPACAGKTGWSFPVRAQNEDHPRVCGENGKPHRLYRGADGSPPRVRGKLCAA